MVQLEALPIGPPRGSVITTNEGKILLLAAQSIAEPGTQAGLPDQHAARIHLKTARGMRCRVGVHRANDAKIIRKFGGVRKQAADLQSALPMPLKFEWRLHDVPDGPAVRTDLFHISLVRRPMETAQGWFGIECVDLTGSAVHEQENDTFGFRRKVRLARRQRVRQVERLG